MLHLILPDASGMHLCTYRLVSWCPLRYLQRLALIFPRGMQVYNYPVVNHGTARGLLQRLRSRLLHLQGERAALQQQLAEQPLDTQDSQAPLRSKVCAFVCRHCLPHALVWPALLLTEKNCLGKLADVKPACYLLITASSSQLLIPCRRVSRQTLPPLLASFSCYLKTVEHSHKCYYKHGPACHAVHCIRNHT